MRALFCTIRAGHDRLIAGSPRWLSGAALTVLLAACVPASTPPPATIAQSGVRQQQSATPVRAVAPRALADTIAMLGQGFDGRVGIAVRDVQTGWVVSWNGGALLPQQSVSKLWVAMAALDAVDRNALSLAEPVTVRRDDLTVFHQPISALIGPNGYRTTVRDLFFNALTKSDNTCNDIVLGKAGGPAAVRAFLGRRGLGGINFGPGERLLQSGIAGLEWKPSYAIGGAFFAARAALPYATRNAALQRYLADPVDGASPDAITDALARLYRGELLSQVSTDTLLSTMAASKTGPGRLKAGVAPGWGFAHKTGTGQELGDLATGYNDVGLLTAPDGRTYAVAVFIADTTRPVPERQALMQAVTRAVIAQHHGLDPSQATAEDFNLIPLPAQETADLRLRGDFPGP